MLNPPGRWAHWCWQDVKKLAEELGAALSSALASPSGVSWAFGQLGAFPGELELSLKPWPKRVRQTGKLDEHQDSTRYSSTMPSTVLPSGTHILLYTYLSQILLLPMPDNLDCQPLSPSHGGLPPYLVSFVATNTTGLGASAGFSF